MSNNFPPLKIANLVRVSTILVARFFTSCRLLGLNVRAVCFETNGSAIFPQQATFGNAPSKRALINGQWPAIDLTPEMGENYLPQDQCKSP